MMGRTHVALGLNTLWLPLSWAMLLGWQLEPQTWLILVVATGLGALVPDLDASASLLQRFSWSGVRPFALPARYLHRRYGHRGALHSLYGLGAFAVLASPTLVLANGAGLPFWWGLLLGYASHLLGDACTRSGIPLFYPQVRRVHALPISLRFSTGSLAEEALFALLCASALALLLRLLGISIKAGY